MLIAVNGFSPEGLPVTLTYDAKDLDTALAFTAAVARKGITAAPPDTDAHKTETIVTVVRREHEDDRGVITPVIDMYPAWKGDYGQFRFTGVYLNTTTDIEAFEAWSGLALDSIPLYSGQVPIQRKQNRVSPYETACRPFVAHKHVNGEKDIDGVMQKLWKFSGYAAAAQSSVNEGTPSPDSTPSPDALPDTPPAKRGAVLPLPGKINPAAAPLSGRTPRR